MAEMNIQEQSSKGKKRAQKRSTSVDLTAMVDLGFLLITFFMLASVFQKPKAMAVNKPAKEENRIDPPEIKESKTLTLVAGKNDKVYCYTGADDATETQVDTLSYSSQELREKILQRKAEVRAQWGQDRDFVVLLKLFPQAKYRNLVDLLDEMAICKVATYAIIDELNETDERLAVETGNQVK